MTFSAPSPLVLGCISWQLKALGKPLWLNHFVTMRLCKTRKTMAIQLDSEDSRLPPYYAFQFSCEATDHFLCLSNSLCEMKRIVYPYSALWDLWLERKYVRYILPFLSSTHSASLALHVEIKQFLVFQRTGLRGRRYQWIRI